jgi:voltage-gated potassium channel
MSLDLTEPQTLAIDVTDLGICFIFIAEFSFGLRKARKRRGFIKERWPDIIGMIPMYEPTLRIIRSFRLVRAARILRLARLGKVFRVTDVGVDLRRIIKRARGRKPR